MSRTECTAYISSNGRCRCAQFYLNTTCVWPQQHNDEENHSNSHCVCVSVLRSFSNKYRKNIIRNVFAMKPPYACIRIWWEVVVSWLVSWMAWRWILCTRTVQQFESTFAFTIHFYSSRWMIRTNVVLFDAKWIRVFSSFYSSGCVMLTHDIAHTHTHWAKWCDKTAKFSEMGIMTMPTITHSTKLTIMGNNIIIIVKPIRGRTGENPIHIWTHSPHTHSIRSRREMNANRK